MRRTAAALVLAVAAFGARAQTIVGTEAIFDVTQPPFFACPDDGSSDAAAIQIAINVAAMYAATATSCTAPIYHPVVFFPKGTYDVTTTLTVFAMFGIELRGAGNSPYDYAPPGTVGTESRLQCNFNGPLLKIWGDATLEIRRLNFAGAVDKSRFSGPLVQVDSSSGYGTSHLTFDSVTFANAGLGLATTNTTNNSEFRLSLVSFDTVDTCFQVGQPNGLNYIFDLVSAFNCGTVFDLRKGGNVSVNVGNFINCNSDYLIKIGENSNNGGGPNLGVSRFANCRIESTPAFRLLSMQNEQKIEFDALHMAMQTACSGCLPVASICDIQNGSVSFNACQFERAGAAVAFLGTGSPYTNIRRNVRFRDCHFNFPSGTLSGSGPFDPRTLGLAIIPIGDTISSIAYDKCEGKDNAGVFVPLLDAVTYPTGQPHW